MSSLKQIKFDRSAGNIGVWEYPNPTTEIVNTETGQVVTVRTLEETLCVMESMREMLAAMGVVV